MTATSNDNRQGDCPMCGRPLVQAHRPFCSPRCADADLGKWLKGSYAIPAVEPPDEADLEAMATALDAENDET